MEFEWNLDKAVGFRRWSGRRAPVGGDSGGPMQE
jgi:hypothetical protein